MGVVLRGHPHFRILMNLLGYFSGNMPYNVRQK